MLNTMEMRLMLFISISFSLKYLAEADVDCGGCFKPPDFTSPYTIMEAQTDQSEAIVEHGLNEVPIKVDVQVRAINTTDHVFPGLGSAQRDDDQPGPYGGVVYKYNEISVVLYVPNKNDGSSSGTIIFTGNNTWNGPYHETEARAEVRAKVWKNCSFPQPQFDSDWFPMAVNNGTKSFKEIAHGLGTYPEYVSVQIKDKNSAWYSDGIGSVMTVQALDQQSAWGGVIYGFNASHVRIWVPGYDSGSLFSTADGWGRGSKEVWNEGFIRVRVWSHFKGDAIYSKMESLVNTKRKKRSHRLSTRSGNTLDIDTGMIYVTVKAIDGNNDGFSFPGMGAVQNADPTESFGGLVYSYGPRAIHVWQHLTHAEGYLIYVNQNWGGGLMSQKSKNASMTVRFWEPYAGRCPTSPVHHVVTVHVDNGNPATSPSRPGSTATINHTVHLHTSTASPTASQSSVHLQTTEVQSTKSTKNTASTLLPADTEKESQSMSGAVLGIIIGACLIVAGGIATGIICALCKKNKRQVEEQNSMNG